MFFDLRLARGVLLYDVRLEAYCRRHCFCPTSEDEFLAADFREEQRTRKLPPAQLSEINPPSSRGKPFPPEIGFPPGRNLPPRKGFQLNTVGGSRNLLAYSGSDFRCMGLQKSETKGMLNCYCYRNRAGPQRNKVPSSPARVVTFSFLHRLH